MTTAVITTALATESAIAYQLNIALLTRLGTHLRTADVGGNILTDAWTIFGTTYTKTYTYASTSAGAAQLTESDWVA